MLAAAPDTPIIVLTGRADEELASDVLRLGVQDYLLKIEMNPDGLVRAMHFALERHEFQRETAEMRID